MNFIWVASPGPAASLAISFDCFRVNCTARAHRERNATKPDLEALLHLPAFADYSYGALLAVPSGSTSQRCRGALLRLDAQGAISGAPERIDFSGRYAT